MTAPHHAEALQIFRDILAQDPDDRYWGIADRDLYVLMAKHFCGDNTDLLEVLMVARENIANMFVDDANVEEEEEAAENIRLAIRLYEHPYDIVAAYQEMNRIAGGKRND